MNLYDEIIDVAMSDISKEDSSENSADELYDIKVEIINKLMEAIALFASLDMISSDGDLLDENGEIDKCENIEELFEKIDALKERTQNLRDLIVYSSLAEKAPSKLDNEEYNDLCDQIRFYVGIYGLLAKDGKIALDGSVLGNDGAVLLDASLDEVLDLADEVRDKYYSNDEK